MGPFSGSMFVLGGVTKIPSVFQTVPGLTSTYPGCSRFMMFFSLNGEMYPPPCPLHIFLVVVKSPYFIVVVGQTLNQHATFYKPRISCVVRLSKLSTFISPRSLQTSTWKFFHALTWSTGVVGMLPQEISKGGGSVY